jgi:hypothetical protein
MLSAHRCGCFNRQILHNQRVQSYITKLQVFGGFFWRFWGTLYFLNERSWKMGHWLYEDGGYISTYNTNQAYIKTNYISKPQEKWIKVWRKFYCICLHYLQLSHSKLRYRFVFLKVNYFQCSLLPGTAVIYPRGENFFVTVFPCNFDTSWRKTRANLQESPMFFWKQSWWWTRFASIMMF